MRSLGARSVDRWLWFVPRYLPGGLSPYVPGQSGYKRLWAALPLINHLIRTMATDADLWTKPV
jgi:hypothetical protein